MAMSKRSEGPAIGVVHLVWAPLGVAPLRRFLSSYRDHPAGAEHELVVVINGGGGDRPDGRAAREEIFGALEGIDHRVVDLQRAVLDLPAYLEAARRLEHEQLCFLNSYSTILVDRWLEHFQRAVRDSKVGLVGATASWESQAEWVRGKARYWLPQLALSRRARNDYPRFPNPHIRTTGFMVARERFVDLGLEPIMDKRSTYLLESGVRNITRQVEERALRAVVVGGDGHVYEMDEWPHSATYRAGRQANLLIADNRTRDWERASPRLRRRLTRDAWGTAYTSERRDRSSSLPAAYGSHSASAELERSAE
jgi:hypothetical protein